MQGLDDLSDHSSALLSVPLDKKSLSLVIPVAAAEPARQPGLNLPPERIEEIKRLSQDPDVYEKVKFGSTPLSCLRRASPWGEAALMQRLRCREVLNLSCVCALSAAGSSSVMQLAQAVAPSIWEMDDVKKGALCLLFGGTEKRSGKNGDGTTFRGHLDGDEDEPEQEGGDGAPVGGVSCRGDINALLCGDPGTR